MFRFIVMQRNFTWSKFYAFLFVCCAGNTVVQENVMYSPWNQPPPIGGNIPPHGYSAFASWNNSQSTQNGRPYIVASHGLNINAAPFYRAISNTYTPQLRADVTVPPQPALSVS
jgi:hypothetical protein